MSEDVWKQDAGNGKIRVDILKLRQILADKSIPELVKRRITALFLEQSIENEENAIWLLHEHEVLEYTLTLISQPVLEEIIRRSVVRMNGISHIAELLSLFDWRSEEHTSELQSLEQISYAVFCLKKKK